MKTHGYKLHGWAAAMAVMITMGLSTGWLSAAFLTSDYPNAAEAKVDHKSKPPKRETTPPRRPPIPHHENPAVRLIRQVQFGTPYRYQHLTIYPLNLTHGQVNSGLRTLDEALRNRWVVIDESSRATVSRLSICNHSRHSIFIMAGEIVGGGKQNRVVQHDLILPPHSGVVQLPVYCVEENRWSSSVGEFKSRANLAHPALRKGAAKRASQDAIWAEVDERSRAAGVVAKSKNYEALYSDRKVQAKLDDCLPHFRRFVGTRTVGAVAVVGHRVVGADLFSDPNLFSRLWDKILRSYALDYISYPHPHPHHHHGNFRRKAIMPDVRGFLNRALSASYTRRHTPGSGTLYRIGGSSEGETIAWGGHAVHVGLFGSHPPIVRPQPVPMPRIPRQR